MHNFSQTPKMNESKLKLHHNTHTIHALVYMCTDVYVYIYTHTHTHTHVRYVRFTCSVSLIITLPPSSPSDAWVCSSTFVAQCT